jgi:hypothetical protein
VRGKHPGDASRHSVTVAWGESVKPTGILVAQPARIAGKSRLDVLGRYWPGEPCAAIDSGLKAVQPSPTLTFGPARIGILVHDRGSGQSRCGNGSIVARSPSLLGAGVRSEGVGKQGEGQW